MEIIPAIDLRGGRCVRLYQGDFAREEVFSEDPVGVALGWQKQGATRLHLVDLDGAVAGAPRNAEVVGRISRSVGVPVQVGGGIRDIETLEKYLGAGVQRVILGTASIDDPGFVEEACGRFGEGIVVGVDAREGYASASGWTRDTRVPVFDLVKAMEALGVRRFIYTDIARDGTLTQPNFDAVARLVSRSCSAIIASGGVSSIAHLVRLRGLGVEGAIVGRALYTGDIDLLEAIEAAS